MGDPTIPRRSTKTVLIIDDSQVVREQVAATLRAASYQVVEACNGVEGLARVKDVPGLALAICDINMPELGGIEVLERLTAQGLLSFPFVVLSSEGQPDLVGRARALGAKGWMMKPVLPASLLAVVNKLTGTPATTK